MSANPEVTPREELPMRGLKHLPIEKIDRNPSNPRIHFTEEEMARLTESIASEGILVPVVVYEKGDGYILIDGERRWRCARELGLESIPAIITDLPNARQNLLLMFNIHQVREAWADMPTAWALQKVIEETGTTANQELSDGTGLSVERIKRLRHALELPKEYQRYIDEKTIPLNFFWELKRNVIEPLARNRPAIAEKLGLDEVQQAFVTKRLNEIITDSVSLRKVRPIITAAAREAEDPTKPSLLDKTIVDLITSEDMTIEEAYEDTIEMMVEADKLERKTNNMVTAFSRLLGRVKTKDDKRRLEKIGRSLIKRIGDLVG